MSSQAPSPVETTLHGKWARRIWLPGALVDVIPIRADEVQQENLSKYLVELITYDLPTPPKAQASI